MQIPQSSELAFLLAFVVPGFVAFQAIRLFSVPIAREGKDFLVAYVTLSALNFAVSGFLIPTVNSIALASEWRVFAWALYVFAMPFIIGVVLGALIQRGALIWLFSVAPLRYIGVKPINHIPTAWDWKFGQTSEQFILIILKDGTQFSGLLGTDSFISSHPSERDLYVQSVYELDEKGNWLATEKSLYVASGEIRTVEFWPVS